MRLPLAILIRRTFCAGRRVGMQTWTTPSTSAPVASCAIPSERKASLLPSVALDWTATGALKVAVRSNVSPALKTPLRSASTNVIQPLMPVVAHVGSDAPALALKHNAARRLRRIASIRAVCNDAIISFDVLARRLELTTDSKPGTAATSRIAATDIATISSIKVNPCTPARRIAMSSLTVRFEDRRPSSAMEQAGPLLREFVCMLPPKHWEDRSSSRLTVRPRRAAGASYNPDLGSRQIRNARARRPIGAFATRRHVDLAGVCLGSLHPNRDPAMPTLRLRLTGSDDNARAIINLLQSIDGIEHVEEVADLMPHMDDADSSSAGLSDVSGPDAHEIEIEAPNESTARKVREAVEALAFDLDALVEFEEEED